MRLLRKIRKITPSLIYRFMSSHRISNLTFHLRHVMQKIAENWQSHHWVLTTRRLSTIRQVHPQAVAPSKKSAIQEIAWFHSFITTCWRKWKALEAAKSCATRTRLFGVKLVFDWRLHTNSNSVSAHRHLQHRPFLLFSAMFGSKESYKSLFKLSITLLHSLQGNKDAHSLWWYVTN